MQRDIMLLRLFAQITSIKTHCFMRPLSTIFVISFIVCICLPAFETTAQIDPKKIDIVRDSFGVPHIFAPTDAEVAYGLAWATAEDDFKTMQWALLASKGMLGRYLGVEGAKIDYAASLLRARDIVEQQYENALTPEFKKILSAYVASVNDYARKHPEEVLIKKAFPVTEKDILTGYVLSFCLMSGINWVLEDIINGKAEQGEVRNGGIGSNAMAFSSRKTKDGKTYLAINSHQPLEGPMSWYEVHLCSQEGWNIIGGTFHGGLSVFHGTNEHLGWAHTINDLDLVDTYRLQMHRRRKNHYWFDNRWEKLEVRKVWLHVKLFPKLKITIPVRKKTYWSKYGPTLKTDYGVYSVRFAANRDIRAAQQWYYMNKATSFSQFYNILKQNAIIRMTTIYADKHDTIFAISTGRLPKRNPKYNWLGVLPGNTSETLWEDDYHPIENLPQILNPECGYLFNVNNSAFEVTCKEENLNPENYDKTMGYGTKPTNRSQRFYELMQQYPGKIDYTDFKKIKYDKQLPDSLIGYNDINLNIFYELDPDEHPDIKNEIMLIRNCPRNATADNCLGIHLHSFWKLFEKSNKLTKEQKKDRKYMHHFFAQCIREAKEEMLQLYASTDMALGDVQRHVRGKIDLPVDGAPDVWKASYGFTRHNGRFKITVGESYIQLVQFDKNGPVIESINAYGASSKPDSPHYTDQMQMYLNEQLKPMTFDKNKIYSSAEAIYHPE
jgi:acyl-homoserine-lactone acylase